MKDKLIENIRASQGFDAALHRGKSIDRTLAPFLLAILLQPDAAKRAAAIAALERRLSEEFRTVVLPAARRIGVDNAARVLKALPGGPRLRPATRPIGEPTPILPSGLPEFAVTDTDEPQPQRLPAEASTAIIKRSLADETARRRILTDAGLRDADRARIVQHLINDSANTLDNRLAAYWLEPGMSVSAKVQHLRELHQQQAEARAKYDRQSEAFRQGETATRPRRPRLDFVDRFAEDVRTDFRQQARRAGADAEIATFTHAGYSVLGWVTVNAAEACPDCRLRQGVRGDARFWDRWGRPGDGRTVCGQSCYCLLIPAESLTVHPGLRNGVNMPRHGVLTTSLQAAELNRSR